MRERGHGRLPRLTVQSSHADSQHASPVVGRIISNSIAPRKSGGTKEWGSGILSACKKTRLGRPLNQWRSGILSACKRSAKRNCLIQSPPNEAMFCRDCSTAHGVIFLQAERIPLPHFFTSGKDSPRIAPASQLALRARGICFPTFLTSGKDSASPLFLSAKHKQLVHEHRKALALVVLRGQLGEIFRYHPITPFSWKSPKGRSVSSSSSIVFAWPASQSPSRRFASSSRASCAAFRFWMRS